MSSSTIRQRIHQWLWTNVPGLMDAVYGIGTRRLKREAAKRSCPECGKTPDPHWYSGAPDMRDDPVAAMLGIWPAVDLCGRCGARVGVNGVALQ